jgi:hypothetical protein
MDLFHCLFLLKETRKRIGSGAAHPKAAEEKSKKGKKYDGYDKFC